MTRLKRWSPLTVTVAAIVVLGLVSLVLWLARKPLAEHLVERARSAEKNAEPRTIDRTIDLALRLNPNSIDARLLKAQRLQFVGDFEASHEILTALSDDDLDPQQQFESLTAQATNLLRMTRLDEARAHFDAALKVAGSLQDRRGELTVHLRLGRMGFYYTHDYEDAQYHLEAARDLAQEIGDKGQGAEAATLLGQLLWWWKEEVADPLPDYFEPALTVFQEAGDRYNEADVLHKIAFFHAYDGNLLEFFKYQDRSIALRETLDDRPGLAHEYLTLGWAYLRLHDTRRARRFLEKSIEVNADGGDLFAYLRAQRLLADCEMRQGFLDEAEARLKRALDRKALGSGTQTVAPEDPFLWGYLGEIARRRDQPLEARTYFEKALAIFSEGNLGISTHVWMLDGLIYSYLAAGDLDRAAEIVAEMEALVSDLNHPNSLRRLELQRAALAEALGDRQAAFRARLKAEQIQLRSVASAPIATDTTSRTHERLLATLLETTIDSSLPALVDGGRLQHARLAFELLEQRNYGFYRDLVVLSVGRKRRDADRAETALAALRAVTERLAEGVSSASAASTLSSRRVSRLQSAYGDYEDVLLRQALADDDYLTVRQARPPGLEEVRNAVASDTALLQYVLADGKAFCLVIRRDRVDVVALPVKRSALAPKVQLFRALALDPAGSDSATSDPQNEGRWRPVARNLFDLLIRPVQDAGLTQGISRLGIIPYGELHDVPFAALLDSAGNPDAVPDPDLDPDPDPDLDSDLEKDRFLIEDFDLFLLPAASLMVSRETSASPIQPRAEGVLAMAISDADDLDPLPFAVEEAESAVTELGGLSLLQNDATETSLKANAGAYRYLHLATHGVNEPQTPLISHLVLRPSDEDDGRLTVGEIFQLDLRADLVVLAGCRTGLSSSPDGSRRGPVGRLGLIQATLHSGARSVLASLAPISDESTLAFMRGFYSELRRSQLGQSERGTLAGNDEDRSRFGQASALARVQRAMAAGEFDLSPDQDRSQSQDRDSGSLAHPRHWAPFILVGAYR